MFLSIKVPLVKRVPLSQESRRKNMSKKQHPAPTEKVMVSKEELLKAPNLRKEKLKPLREERRALK